MDSEQSNKLLVFLRTVWEEISRHFLSCDCNSRCYSGESVIVDDGGQNAIRVSNGYLVFAYFCPLCGRRLTPASSGHAPAALE